MSAIKPHMLTHFPGALRWFGPSKTYDMVQYEHAHVKQVKQIYETSARKPVGLIQSMMKKVLIIASKFLFTHH